MSTTALIAALVAGVASAQPSEPRSIDAATPAAASTTIALRADVLHVGDGTQLANGIVAVRDGKIIAVGRELTLPAGTPVVKLEGHLAAGMIALSDASGGEGELSDATRPVLPDAEVAWGIDSKDKAFERALRSGITSVLIAPSPDNLVGGIAAVVKTHGGEIVLRRAFLGLVFGSAALSDDRFPTSYGSAIAELEARFAKPEGAFAQAAKGELRTLMEVERRQDVLAAIRFAKEHGLRGVLYGTAMAGELVEQVRASGLHVVLPPLDPKVSARELEAATAIAKSGVPFGLALDSPDRHPDTLRLSAAMLIRQGAEPTTVWRALTSDAARVAGVAGRLGSIAEGKDADLVLWSGAPIDLASRVKTVWVNGAVVWEANGEQR